VIVGKAGGGGLPDVSLKLMLQHCGFRRVTELGEYESLTFAGGRIIGAPFYGEHADLDIRGKLAYGIEMKQASCLFFADSNPPHCRVLRAVEEADAARRLHVLRDGMCRRPGYMALWAAAAEDPDARRGSVASSERLRRREGVEAASVLRSEVSLYLRHGRRAVVDSIITSILYSGEATQFKEARRVESTLRPQGRSAERSSARWSCCCEEWGGPLYAASVAV